MLAGLMSSDVAMAEANKQELVILTWSEYISEELIAAFETEHNAKVQLIAYASDEERNRTMVQTQNKGIDLIVVEGVSLRSYIKQGWIQPIDKTRLRNYQYLDNELISAFAESEEYALPYFWGTLGIAYRQDMVPEPITSWKQFFSPDESLKGKVIMVRSSRDMVSMALKALGHSANSEEPSEIQKAGQLLMQQKPFIAEYNYPALDETSGLVKGSIAMAMIYGGDALNIAEHNDQVTYALPEEGGNIWIDYFVVSSQSQNEALALSFLDFINDPQWAALNAEEMYLASPNQAAQKRIPAEMLSDEVIYPGEAELQNSEFYMHLSPRSIRARKLIFNQVVN